MEGRRLIRLSARNGFVSGALLLLELRLPVFFLFLAIFFLYLPCNAPAAIPSAVVCLRSPVEVDRPTLQLQDLADIRCDIPALRAALGSMDVGKSPEPGLKRIVMQAHLRVRLTAAHGDDVNLILSGPSSVVVTRRHQMLPPDAVKKTIRDYVEQHTAYPPDQVQIKYVRFGETRLPTGALELRVLERPSFKVRDPFYISLDVLRQGQRVRTVLVEVGTEIRADVIVAARPLARGESITPDMLRTERLDVTQWLEGVFLDARALLGAVLRVPVEAGRPLHRQSVDRPTLVRRGDIVTLTVEGPFFRLSTKAKARAPGRYGDVIEVVHADNGKSVPVEVIGPREVKSR